MFGISFLLFLNLLTLLELILILEKKPFTSLNTSSQIIVVTFMVLIFTYNYNLFVRKNKFHEIVAEFQSESKIKRRRSTLMIKLYIVLSFIVPITIAWLYGIYMRRIG